MKAKVTYLLINADFGSIPRGPHLVCGSNKNYGHAHYRPEFKSHVFEVPQETWEKGMDRDIAKNAHRTLNRWIVRAKVEPIFEEAEQAMVDELDKAKADLAQAIIDRNTAILARDAAMQELETVRGMLERAHAAQAPAATAAATAESIKSPVVPVPDTRTLTAENQQDWSYQEIQALAKERGLTYVGVKRADLLAQLLPQPAAV